MRRQTHQPRHPRGKPPLFGRAVQNARRPAPFGRQPARNHRRLCRARENRMPHPDSGFGKRGGRTARQSGFGGRVGGFKRKMAQAVRRLGQADGGRYFALPRCAGQPGRRSGNVCAGRAKPVVRCGEGFFRRPRPRGGKAAGAYLGAAGGDGRHRRCPVRTVSALIAGAFGQGARPFGRSGGEYRRRPPEAGIRALYAESRRG